MRRAADRLRDAPEAETLGAKLDHARDGLGRHRRAQEPAPDRHAAAPAQDPPVGEGRHRALVVVDVGRVLRHLVPVDGSRASDRRRRARGPASGRGGRRRPATRPRTPARGSRPTRGRPSSAARPGGRRPTAPSCGRRRCDTTRRREPSSRPGSPWAAASAEPCPAPSRSVVGRLLVERSRRSERGSRFTAPDGHGSTTRKDNQRRADTTSGKLGVRHRRSRYLGLGGYLPRSPRNR